MPILHAFTEFPNEAALIGRLFAGYADLEIDLMHSVKNVRDDLDSVLKAMFRPRSESQRINIADGLGRQYYTNLGLGTQFEMAIGAIRHCLKIRNQYAHCVWWNDNTGRLALANLEEIANSNELVEDMSKLTCHHVIVQHLESQLDYYEYTDELLGYIIHEGNSKMGKVASPKHRTFPGSKTPPPIFMD